MVRVLHPGKTLMFDSENLSCASALLQDKMWYRKYTSNTVTFPRKYTWFWFTRDERKREEW